jgi:hypothetical protein
MRRTWCGSSVTVARRDAQRLKRRDNRRAKPDSRQWRATRAQQRAARRSMETREQQRHTPSVAAADTAPLPASSSMSGARRESYFRPHVEARALLSGDGE